MSIHLHVDTEVRDGKRLHEDRSKACIKRLLNIHAGHRRVGQGGSSIPSRRTGCGETHPPQHQNRHKTTDHWNFSPRFLYQGINNAANHDGGNDSRQPTLSVDVGLVIQMVTPLLPKPAGFELGIELFQVFRSSAGVSPITEIPGVNPLHEEAAITRDRRSTRIIGNGLNRTAVTI